MHFQETSKSWWHEKDYLLIFSKFFPSCWFQQCINMCLCVCLRHHFELNIVHSSVRIWFTLITWKCAKTEETTMFFFPVLLDLFPMHLCVFLRWQLTNYGPSQKTNVCAVVQMAQQTDKIASILLSLVTQFFFFFFFFTLLEIYRIDFWPIEKFSLLSRRLFIYWDWKCFSKTNKRNCENL